MKLFSTDRNRDSKIKLLSAPAMQAFWQEAINQSSYLQQADIIFACPQTYKQAKRLYGKKKVILVKDSSVLNLKINSLIYSKDKYFNVIGIISPYLTDASMESLAITSGIVKLCSCLIFISDRLDIGASYFRRTLHEKGFYEIAVPANLSQYDFSSVGIFPDGTHDFYSRQLGMPVGPYVTFISSKYPLTNYYDSDFSWKTVFGNPIISRDGFVKSEKDSLVIIVNENQVKEFNPELDAITIKAEAKWEKYGAGHASLIGSYQGPDDTHMYAALLQLIEQDDADHAAVNVSLWINNGEWRLLSNSTVIAGQTQNNTFSLPFSLLIFPCKIIVRAEGKTLLEYEDANLKRTSTAGIRVFSDAIALANISVHEEICES